MVASFIAFGMLHSAGTNSFERVSDATHASYERNVDSRNTAINVSDAHYQGGHLDLNVTNTGTTTHTINSTDVLVDGVYYPPSSYQWARIVGAPNSEYWLPGDTLYIRIRITSLSTPARVKVVTEYGISDVVVVA